MSTVFITHAIWPQLTNAVRGSRQSCAVAVAYFGAGAGRLLPLPKNSRLVVDAIARRDYPIIQGTMVVFAGIYVLINLLVDLSYGLLDPRIRYH